MKYGKAVIVGCVKNSSEYLDDVFDNIQKISQMYNKVECVFIENDSTDDTKKKILEWNKRGQSVNLISFDGLDAYQSVRTMRLEIARNAYLDQIKNNPKYVDFDHMIVIDMDDRGSYPIDVKEFDNALRFLNAESKRAAVFANQKNCYYDLWALRHETMCPFDFWHEVVKEAVGNTDDLAFSNVYGKVIKNIPEFESPIKVESAFGGLGIYKISYVKKNLANYVGYKYEFFNTTSDVFFSKLQTCEHVSFNRGIVSQGGELFIIPNLINSDQMVSINPIAYHSMIIRD